MKTLRKKCIATSAALLLASMFMGAAAQAAPLGAVTHLDGILLVKKAAGKAKVLSGGSPVEQGDTLLTDADTYARVRFADGTDLTLGPETQLVAVEPASFVLLKGALRGSGRFTLKIDETTVDVQGSFVIEWVPEPAKAAFLPIRLAALDSGTFTDAPGLLAQTTPTIPGAGLAAGLYVHVVDGAINLSNKGGSTNFSAGQFGYTANQNKPPVVVPTNPGIKFTPPPSFSSSSNTNAGSGNKSANVDCEVR